MRPKAQQARSGRGRPGQHRLIVSLIGLLVGLTVAAPVWAQVDDPAWLLLEAGPSVTAEDLIAPLPAGGWDSWSGRRSAHEVGRAPLGVAPISAATQWLASIASDDDALEWERALVVAALAVRQIDRWTAERWLEVLEAPRDEEWARRVTWTAVYVAGGAAALLPPECMPSDASALATLTRLGAAVERRYGAAWEALLGLPGDDALRRAVEGEGGQAVDAALRFLAAGYPAIRTVASSPDAACDPALVEAAAGWAELGRADQVRFRDGLEAVFETHRVPGQLLRRAALHWYLETWPEPIARMADLAEQGGARPVDVAALRALAAGAGADAVGMQAAARSLEPGDGPFVAWVLAESERQRGEYERALELASRATRSDPFFFAAYMTRASALIALGRQDEAYADLEFLRRTYAEHGVYGPWVERMGRRLR